MKQGFKACVCAVVLCAELFAAGALSAYAAQEQPLPDSGMTLDTAELTLDITEGRPGPGGLPECAGTQRLLLSDLDFQ